MDAGRALDSYRWELLLLIHCLSSGRVSKRYQMTEEVTGGFWSHQSQGPNTWEGSRLFEVKKGC
jgi:hypothetical protein